MGGRLKHWDRLGEHRRHLLRHHSSARGLLLSFYRHVSHRDPRQEAGLPQTESHGGLDSHLSNSGSDKNQPPSTRTGNTQDSMQLTVSHYIRTTQHTAHSTQHTAHSTQRTAHTPYTKHQSTANNSAARSTAYVTQHLYLCLSVSVSVSVSVSATSNRNSSNNDNKRHTCLTRRGSGEAGCEAAGRGNRWLSDVP
jgi:hypothetical protein